MVSNLIMLHFFIVLTLGCAASAFGQTTFSGSFQKAITLKMGEVVEVSAGVTAPSKLPANARIAIEWGGLRKVIHALDPDFFVYFRAPKAGVYTLKATSIEDEEPLFNQPRWREPGSIALLRPFPKQIGRASCRERV